MSSTLIETYNEIAQKIRAIRGRATAAEAELYRLKTDSGIHIQARIKRLEEQLEKIDEYQLKIKAFQQLAERNLESRNLQTIEAPPGYRVNLNRLRQWAMMIDPTASNDPYAQRVYVVAKCDELFLEKKKREFTDRIEALKTDESIEQAEEAARIERELTECRTELQNFCFSQEMSEFAKRVEEANAGFCWRSAPERYRNAVIPPEELSPGAYAAPLDVPAEQRSTLKSQMGPYYDTDTGRVLLPLTFNANAEFAAEVSCAPSRIRQMDRAVRNLILNVVERYPAGEERVYVLDAIRYNTASVAGLKMLEDSFALAKIPRSPEQLSDALLELLSSFSDLDEQLELYDSVVEYNRDQKESTERLPRTTLIVYGWPEAFGNEDRERMQRIMMNYERFGVSLFCISFRGKKWEEQESTLPGYAAQTSLKFRMEPKETLVRIGDNNPQRFVWYTLGEDVSEDYCKSVRAASTGRKIIGNKYILRYSLTERPSYTRAYKKIELPFGIDGRDEAHSLSFENENFATYVVGASRSGKSTLLHTLIAGLIRNYHPDNVELWLADFKQLEFKNYIEFCPPHVKYVLLDESTELVFDLIDKLTEKMMERQRIFSRLHIERIDQADPATLDEPMPLIFVILDEFSIMSQSIAESPIYKLKLQNLLAKGGALGIRFLFSSQTFTTGVAGLTPTARAQIQQRISMKGAKEEITETLELSANLKTEQVLNWIDALPPHYALVKTRIDADTPPQVRRYLVMYFPDYGPRNRMIQELSEQMRSVDAYAPGDINTYVKKHPVFVDGNSYDAFPAETAKRLAAENKADGGLVAGNTLVLLGTPRLMERIRPITLSQETRENILLICRAAEQTCGASVLSTVMRCALLQGRRVRVWAYEKNPVYRFCREAAWNSGVYAGVDYSEGIDQVCNSIAAMKENLRSKAVTDELIILLGMDRIFSDFEFFAGDTGAVTPERSLKESVREQEKAMMAQGVIAVKPEDIYRSELAKQWQAIRTKRNEQLKKEGKSREEIKRILAEENRSFMASAMKEYTAKEDVPAESPKLEKTALTTELEKEKRQEGAYNAAEDFQYVVMQGSRLGRHFLLLLGDLSDVKTAGVRLDWFRHKMAFQVSADDSSDLFRNRHLGSTLPPHICQYSDALNSFSFRPYLHQGIGWDGWSVDITGAAVSPF